MFTTSGTYPWSFVTQIFHNGEPSHGVDRKSDDFNLTKRNSWFSSFLVSSNPLSRKSSTLNIEYSPDGKKKKKS